MKKKLRLMMTMLLLAVMGSVWADEVTLTNANIVSAGTGATGYQSWSITDDNDKEWNAYAIKNQHSNATSGYHYLQIKKYGSNTAYYIQVPEYGTKITSITMTVSNTSSPMSGGSNSATLYFSSSNSTSAAGTGVASGTGSSSVTIDCSGLNLNTGYITASGAVRIWDVKVVYENGSQIATVATPTFTPSAGEVARGTVVTFNCTTDGVTYYYTTDGSNPTTNSASATSYTVNADVTLKVIAVKDGMENSSVAIASYTVAKNNPNLAFSDSRVTANIGESFTPPTLSYADGYDGNITYSSSNSAITVNETTGEVTYDDSAVGKTTTITASASETDNYTSGTASYVLTVVDPNSIEGNLNNATFGTNYTGSITPIADFTSVSGQIEGVIVTYAKGSSSNAYINASEIRLYNGIELTFTAPDGYYIKSLTFNNELALCESSRGRISGSMWSSGDDDVSSVTITRVSSSGNVRLSTVTISLAQDASAIAKPTITPSSGTYTSAQTVTITNNAEGATVYYTTDGSAPTASSSVYSNPFELSKNGTYTVRAIAINGDEKSGVVTSNIVINIHVDAPVFTETDGTTFSEPYTIHLTSTQGTTIYYTTGTASPIDENGNLSADAKVYNATTGISNLTNAVTIKAVAIDQWGNVSIVSTASYKYIGEVTLPYYENFDEGLGNFTTYPTSTGANEVKWEFAKTTEADIAIYGEIRKYARIKGGTTSTTSDNSYMKFVGNDYLVSPVIDMSNITSATLNFIHAGHYFGTGSDSNTDGTDNLAAKKASCKLYVRDVTNGIPDDVTSGWTDISERISNWFYQETGSNGGLFPRVNSGDISLDSYVGKKIQISFYFTTDATMGGYWNVLKFAVTGTQQQETVNYETVNMSTDGYITYVVKNDIDWEKTLAMKNNVHGFKVIQFTERANNENGTTVLVEFGFNEEMSVDPEYALNEEQQKPLWSEKIIPAETPIILKGNEGANLLVIAKNDDVIPAVKGNLLKPSYGDVTASDAQTLYVLQKTSNWIESNPYENYLFYVLGKGSNGQYRTVPNRKAYLNAKDASEEVIYHLIPDPNITNPGMQQHVAPFLILTRVETSPMVSDDAGIVDGINAVDYNNRLNDNMFYSISGVKVNNPSKGIYILNGKKILVK